MVVVMAMPVVVVMARPAGVVGAALRVESRVDGNHSRAEPTQQRLECRIVPQADAVRQDMHRHVAVPQGPRDPRKPGDVVHARFDERLG